MHNTKLRLSRGLITCCLLATQLGCAVNADAMKSYKEWAQLPSAQLFEMGNQYRNATPSQTDSALVCYTIVANRYYGGRRSATDDVRFSVMSISIIGSIYYYLYYDYEKAFANLTEALQIAQNSGQTDLMASIHFDLSNLYTVYAQINNPDAPHAYEEALHYCKLALREADENALQSLKLKIVMALCDYAFTTATSRMLPTSFRLSTKTHGTKTPRCINMPSSSVWQLDSYSATSQILLSTAWTIRCLMPGKPVRPSIFTPGCTLPSVLKSH